MTKGMTQAVDFFGEAITNAAAEIFRAGRYIQKLSGRLKFKKQSLLSFPLQEKGNSQASIICCIRC